MNKRKAFWVAALVTVAMLLTCCAPAATPTPVVIKEKEIVVVTPTPPPKRTVRIGFLMPWGLINATAVAYQNSVVMSAKHLGWEVVVGDAKWDAGIQANIMEDWIAMGLDAIIVNPQDSKAIIASIDRANAAGIPVFNLDRTAEGGDVKFAVGGDHYDGAYKAGLRMVELLTKKYGEPRGLVLNIQGDLAAIDAKYRSDGFTDVTDKYPNIKVVSKPCKWQLDLAQSTVADFIGANPDVDGIYIASDYYIDAVVSGMEMMGRALPREDPKHIFLVSFDGQPAGLRWIREGICDGTASQSIPDYGILVYFIKQYLDGKPLPKAGDIFELKGASWSPFTVRQCPAGPCMPLGTKMVLPETVDDPTWWGNQPFESSMYDIFLRIEP